MRRLAIFILLSILTVLSVATVQAADKLGKIFIKASSSEVNGKQFSDAALEDSVKDLEKRLEKGQGPFILASSESEAEFLLVVVERKVELSGYGGQSKNLYAMLSVKEGGEWKPGTRLSGGGDWYNAARLVMVRAATWAKANREK